MTDNTRAIQLLDAMLNRIIGTSYILLDPEWTGWALGVKLALKRQLDATDDEATAAAILSWLATSNAPPQSEVRRG